MSPHHEPELVDDAVEEVLIRCPPDDPASLLRAALVCKAWSRVVSKPGFRRRYAERHRAAPALGFLCNIATGTESAHFVPTSVSFRPPRAVHRKMRVIDARHGRVLLLHGPPSAVSSMAMRLVIWNPVTDEHWELPAPPVAVHPSCWNAAVICAATGCDHLDCHHGPVKVVIVGFHPDQMCMYSCTYSSESGGMWSTHMASSMSFLDLDCYFKLKPSALVGNALYFVFMSRTGPSRILKYDLTMKEMSVIHLPRTRFTCPRICLTTTDHGRLGFVEVGVCKLYIWSRVDGLSTDAGWYQSRVVDLKMLPPPYSSFDGAFVGFAGSVGIIFLATKDGNFLIDLKANRARKLGEDRSFYGVFPFTSFCIPASAAAMSPHHAPKLVDDAVEAHHAPELVDDAVEVHHTPELVDDAVEEVLLRCPPDDPARLLRAALACRRWRRLVSSPAFRHRYAERHRAGGSALGFVCNLGAGFNKFANDAHFIPTTPLSSFRLPGGTATVHRKMRVLDARHGRILLQDVDPRTSSSHRTRLVVWNPITGERRELPNLPVVVQDPSFWKAAMLCAAAGDSGSCDHLGCHQGHFRVVVVGIDAEQMSAYSCAYSSEPGCVWSVRTAAALSQQPGCSFEMNSPSALAGNAVYFTFRTRLGYIRIMKYDLATEQMSVMKIPSTGFYCPRIVLMTMEDGGLGFAIVGECKLYLWSAVLDGSDSGGVLQWYQSGVVDLRTLLPANALKASPGTVGFAGGGEVIFLGTKVGNFVVDVKSNRAIKLGDGRSFHSVVPFTSFCVPR
ncbi:unnamed protein product [Urochloa decumbens]|uniref:F-box domain-containing protein n=1 Tax=Urochloa decumbens TaxID=240449 RepID=A0ABC9FND1_9POAL